MKKQQQRYTSERGTFWLFILPKIKLFESVHFYTHALLKSKQWISIYKKSYIKFQQEGVKQARKIFGKVLQSKRLRGTKKRRKKNTMRISYSERGNFLVKFLRAKG